jgi:hypothetical protein
VLEARLSALTLAYALGSTDDDSADAVDAEEVLFARSRTKGSVPTEGVARGSVLEPVLLFSPMSMGSLSSLTSLIILMISCDVKDFFWLISVRKI